MNFNDYDGRLEVQAWASRTSHWRECLAAEERALLMQELAPHLGEGNRLVASQVTLVERHCQRVLLKLALLAVLILHPAPYAQQPMHQQEVWFGGHCFVLTKTWRNINCNIYKLIAAKKQMTCCSCAFAWPLQGCDG